MHHGHPRLDDTAPPLYFRFPAWMRTRTSTTALIIREPYCMVQLYLLHVRTRIASYCTEIFVFARGSIYQSHAG